MRELFLLALVVGGSVARNHHTGDKDDVKDYGRACLDGFFYAGEPREDLPAEDRDWDYEGERTPVYSCYSIVQVGDDEDEMSLSGATLRCNDMRGQLLSINDTLEEVILTGQSFVNRLQDQDVLYLTSGLSLAQDNWTWIGADQPVDDEILDGMTEEKIDEAVTQCMTISWTRNENGSTVLTYTAVPCLQTFTHAICEVRVYTQTWYVWFGANWLQILFFFTLAVLIFTCCCMMQAWFWKSGRQPAVAPVRPRPQNYHHSDLPPSYNEINRNADSTRRNAAGRYAEKGREILAKVIYFRPSSGNPEKPPLPQ